ncbi:universal stress protein [Curtobacterium sp. NPDC098951]|uniref:universal stress protein n=1 Tax=Curtobacterium sp. NPDC098951 TaxID=3363974 RepID=UPI00382F277F
MTRYTVAVDDSDAAQAAVEWLAGVVDPGLDVVKAVSVPELVGDLPSRAEHRLLEARAVLLHHQPRLRVTTDLVDGGTVRGLLRGGATGDVLVIGGRQRRRLLAAVRGRVAERVVAEATMPVIVVPEERVELGGPVVLGVDSRSGAAALAYAGALAARWHRELVLVRAWQSPSTTTPFGAVYFEGDLSTWERTADLQLEAALHAVDAAHPDVAVLGRPRRGSAGHVLLHESASASLVVVGRRHRSAVTGLLSGSVGERLMHEAHVPVLIVPPRAMLPGDLSRPTSHAPDTD